MEDDGQPALKRARRLQAAGGLGPSQPGLVTTPSSQPGASWTVTLDQLQVFSSSSDISTLDLQLLVNLLSEAAATDPAGSRVPAQLQQQLAQQLQQLSADACQVLLEELQQQQQQGTTGKHPSPGQAGSPAAVLSDAGQAFLLAHALLPKLQSLGAAAPKPVLACLTVLGTSSLQCVLVDSVLAPLVVHEDLLPVQVQLLAKLVKEVDSLQPRLLHLLLVAASASAGQLSSGATQLQQQQLATASGIMLGSSCCWREAHANLMKALLDTSPQLVAQQLPSVLLALQAAVQQPALSKATAFGQLLMALLKNFGATFSKQQVEELQVVVSHTSTFLTKSLTIKLQQLHKQHEMAT